MISLMSRRAKYARIVHGWIESAGMDSSFYGTHSMRRTKAAQIYRKTGNLRAVQLPLGHKKIESTVRYLGSRSTMRSVFLRKSSSKRRRRLAGVANIPRGVVPAMRTLCPFATSRLGHQVLEFGQKVADPFVNDRLAGRSDAEAAN